MIPEDLNQVFLLIFVNYGLTLFCFYWAVAFIIYANRNSRIKMMQISLDPKRTSRGRKNIVVSIEKDQREKRLAWAWPIFLIEGLAKYVKTKLKKEE